jgi:hypothetical protein
MNFAKFADLLRSQLLYLCRIDRLPDRLESLHSLADPHSRHSATEALHASYPIRDDRDKSVLQGAYARQWQFVNCWHLNDRESRTMWQLYAPSGDSVVVVSSVGLLCGYAHKCSALPDYQVIVRRVKYASEYQARPDFLSWGPAVFKDLRYRVEREIRLIASVNARLRVDENGIKLSVCVLPMVRRVVLHPHATSSFRRTVFSLIEEYAPWLTAEDSSITGRLY